MFNITLFGFIISRPLISFFKGAEWWYFEGESVNFALNGVMLSLIFMLAGYSFYENLVKSKIKDKINKGFSLKIYFKKYKTSPFVYNLKIVSLILFFISIFFFFISEAEKLAFMRNRSYTDLYASFKTQLPYVIGALGSMNKYFLCIFLATLPKKELAFIPLSLYIISAVPELLIGARNPIVLNVIFVFLYYFTRDSIDDTSTDIKKSKINQKGIKAGNTLNKLSLKKSRKWLGNLEWAFIILLAPICIVFLGLYNYIREGTQAESSGILGIIIDLLYKQGVSFDVLCIGYSTIPKIEYSGFKNYTFGGIIDYFTHGKLAQVLFGASPLGEGNNLEMALYSNNFSHRMSYASRGQEYLDGHGWGSSFILETYADFGYLGIILFSLFLGMIFAYMIKLMSKGSFSFTIFLVILTGIYFCPRDSALGWLNFLFYLQFIIPVLLCYLAADLCVKKYQRKKHMELYSNIPSRKQIINN